MALILIPPVVLVQQLAIEHRGAQVQERVNLAPNLPHLLAARFDEIPAVR